MTTAPINRTSATAATAIMRQQTGIVIPVYLPQDLDTGQGQALLEDTTRAYCAQVDDPARVCLSVDGNPLGAQVARRLAHALGTSICVAAVNRGKLSGAANGVRTLLSQGSLAYVAIVDQDGDHFANELLNFIRVAQHIQQHTADDRIMVLGQRASRHLPMGFLRGELEELADRILLDALAYDAAVTNRPMRLGYAFSLGEFPDFHSGYKLFSHSTAEAIFNGVPHLAGVSEDCYYRHACEAVMVVEGLAHGAYLGVVNRTTVNEQPISVFGQFNQSQLVADQIIWPCKRLNIPLPFVRQWMANHVPRLLLHTLAPEGKEELARIRQLVLDAFGDTQGQENETPMQPLFV